MIIRISKSRCAGSKASVLVEAMVGVAVAGIVMAAAYAGVASGFHTMQMTRENLRATQIMLERLEAIRGCSWYNLTNSPPGDFVEYYTPTGEGTGTGIPFYGTVSISTPSIGTPTYLADLRSVTVSLTWTNHHRGDVLNYTGPAASSTYVQLARTRQMTTFVTRNGLQSYVTRMQ